MDSQWWALLASLFGGIALFLLGMELLGDGMKRAAGPRVQAVLSGATGNRVKAASVGALASTLIHSGPTTVLVLGFVNAGVLTLTQAVPLVFGANIGTTLSMQIAAFDVGKYAVVVVGLGVLLRRVAKTGLLRELGLVLIGFGLLFLGLETMKLGLAPVAKGPELREWLAWLDTKSLGGFSLALVLSIGLTVAFQSSGVIVSVLFSMAALGVVDDFHVAIPFFLGAHIGTCSMTIIAAQGGTLAAWRTALCHLAFNVLGAGLAVIMIPFYDWLIPRLSDDLVRQMAHFNTAKQVVNVLILLPFTGVFAHVAKRLTAEWKGAEVEASHLDPKLFATPEAAILAVVRELRRQAGIVNDMLRATLDGLVTLDATRFRSVASQEAAVDLIKKRSNEYIGQIARRNNDPARVEMLQRLVVASSAVERIGDHVEVLMKLAKTKMAQDLWLPDDHMRQLLSMSHLICEMLDDARDAIDPTEEGARKHAARALRQRDRFRRELRELRSSLTQWIRSPDGNAPTALLEHRFLLTYDRMAEQLRILACQETQPDWAVRDSGLTRREGLAPPSAGRPENHPIHQSFDEAVRDLGIDDPTDHQPNSHTK